MRNECLDAALNELTKAGIRDSIVARGSKHLQVRWSGPRGEPRMVSVACTPSDVREIENTRRDVRRVLRADGLLDEAPTVPARQPSRIELLERRVHVLERQLAGWSRRPTPTTES
jgi:hypothetical protein